MVDITHFDGKLLSFIHFPDVSHFSDLEPINWRIDQVLLKKDSTETQGYMIVILSIIPFQNFCHHLPELLHIEKKYFPNVLKTVGYRVQTYTEIRDSIQKYHQGILLDLGLMEAYW